MTFGFNLVDDARAWRLYNRVSARSRSRFRFPRVTTSHVVREKLKRENALSIRQIIEHGRVTHYGKRFGKKQQPSNGVGRVHERDDGFSRANVTTDNLRRMSAAFARVYVIRSRFPKCVFRRTCGRFIVIFNTERVTLQMTRQTRIV